MLPSFLKKQRKQREKTSSPPGSPGSFFSPNLERSPESSPPPLPPLPAIASTSTPSSFPHDTHFPWPPQSMLSLQQRSQASPQPQPRPPALKVAPAASTTSPPATAVNTIGSPEIQLDLGFTSESLLDGFTGFFDRTASVRTGSPAPAGAPGQAGPSAVNTRPIEPPNMGKPTPPTPTLTPSTATASTMPVPPSVLPSATGSGSAAGTSAGINTSTGTGTSTAPDSRAASRSRSDALSPLKIPVPSISSKTLPILASERVSTAHAAPGVSLLPLSLPFTAPSPTSPHPPSPSPSSTAGQSGASQYSSISPSAFSRADDPNVIYTDTDTDTESYSDSDSAWSYASAPDLDWGISPGVSYTSIPFGFRGGDPAGDPRHPGSTHGGRRRRTSTGSVGTSSAWRTRNSHRLTRQDSATLPFDPEREAFFGNMERPSAGGTGGKRSRRNSEKRVSRRASDHRQSRRGSRHSRKSRPASAGVGPSFAGGPIPGPASASASRPGSASGAGTSFGTFGSFAGLSPVVSGPLSSSSGVNGAAAGMALTPVEPMPEDAAAVVRASGGGSGGRQKKRSTKRRSPGVHNVVPPVPGGGRSLGGAGSSAGVTPGSGEKQKDVSAAGAGAGEPVVGDQQDSQKASDHGDAAAYANAELTLEDALTRANGYRGMDGAVYDGMGLGMGDMGPEVDTAAGMSKMLSGGVGLDGIMGRLERGRGSGADARALASAMKAGSSAAPSLFSPVNPNTAALPGALPRAASQAGRGTPPRLAHVRGVQESLGRSRSAQATVGAREEGSRVGAGVANNDKVFGGHAGEGEDESSLGLSGMGLGRNASASAVVGVGSKKEVLDAIRPLPPSPSKDSQASPPRQRTPAPLRPLPTSPTAGAVSRPRTPLPAPPVYSAAAQPSAQYFSQVPPPAKPPPFLNQTHRQPTAPTHPTHPPLTQQLRSFSAPDVSSAPSPDLLSPDLRSPAPRPPDSSTSVASPAAGTSVRSASPDVRSASPGGSKFMHPPRPAVTYSAWKSKSTNDVSQNQAQVQSPSSMSTSTHTQTPTPKAEPAHAHPVSAASPPGSGFSATSSYSISSFPIVAATADGAGGHGPGVRRMSANQLSDSGGTSPAPSYQLSETSSTASTTSLGRGTLPIGNGNVSKPPATAVERLQQRARADREPPRRINTAPLNTIYGPSERPYPTLLHRELSTNSAAAFPETPQEFSPLISPASAHMATSSSPATVLPMPSRRMMPRAPMIDPAPPPKRRSRPPLPIGPRKPSVRVVGGGGLPAGVVHGASSSSSSSVSLVTTNTSGSGPAAVAISGPPPVATGVTRGSSVGGGNAGNNAASKLTAYTPPSPKFQTRPVRWRGLTMDAAKWTLTSGQLQDIVGRAIRQSAEASSIRLLTLDVLDKEIPEEIRRLEVVRDEIKSKYRGTVRRRRVLFRSVTLFAEGNDSQTRARLAQELMDVSIACDTLTEELFRVMDELQQLHRLRDVHSASALAMALRKLNSSFLKQSADAQDMARHVSQLEAERDEAWATAERIEHDLVDLQAKIDVLRGGKDGTSTPSSASNRSSRVSAARKTSLRASKASLRLSRGALSSHSSTSSQRLSTFAPPVPPIPRLPYASPHMQALPLTLSLNTDIPTSSAVGSPYSRGLSSAMVTGGSPTPEALALVEAQNELCDMLGISRADLQRTRSGRSYGYNNGHQRPASELSPSSMPGSPFLQRESSPLVRAMSDMLVPPAPGGRRRNASFSTISRPADSMYMDIPEA